MNTSHGIEDLHHTIVGTASTPQATIDQKWYRRSPSLFSLTPLTPAL